MIRVVEAITDTNIGGAGRHLLNRIKNSDKSKFEYIVVLPKRSALIPLLEKAKINFFVIDGGYDKSFDLKGFVGFYNTFKTTN